MKKQRNKLKQSDIQTINNAYFSKVEEYNKLSLDELRTLFTDSLVTGAKRINGIYKRALFDVVTEKRQQEMVDNAKDGLTNTNTKENETD
jgi:hypothetical protein